VRRPYWKSFMMWNSKLHFFCLFVFFLSAPSVPGAFSIKTFLYHTRRRATVGRTPLDEWSARRRVLYLTTHNTHNRQTSKPLVGFEHTISACDRPQTYALDRATTGTGCIFSSLYVNPALNWGSNEEGWKWARHALWWYNGCQGIERDEKLVGHRPRGKKILNWVLGQDCTNSVEIYEPNQNCRRHYGNMKLAPYWRPTNVRRHCTKFGRHGVEAPWVCALLC
jgi:hypothetical protein